MNIVWTNEARARLRDIRAYIAEESPGVAAEVVHGLVVRSQQLEVAPNSGRPVPEYPDESVRELLERPYRLIYQQVGDDIFILTVQHYRQRLPRQLRDLASGK